MKNKNQNKNQNRNSVGELFTGKYRNIIMIFLLDLGFAFAVFWLTRFIVYYEVPPEPNYLRFENLIMVIMVTITVAMLVFFDCYNSVWKYAGRIEFLKFLSAYIVTFICLMLFKLVMQQIYKIDIWASLILIYLFLSAIISSAMRFAYGIFHYLLHIKKIFSTKNNASRVIVYGAGYTGSMAVKRFINNDHEGFYPVAIIDDDIEKHGKKIYGVPVAGGSENLKEIFEKYKPDLFIIAIISLTKSQLKKIFNSLSEFNKPVKILPAMTNADNLTNKSLQLADIDIEMLLGRDEHVLKQELVDFLVHDKVVCVTGGAGSIGSELCRQSLDFGCKHLVIFDQHENGMFELNQELCQKYDSSRFSLVMGTVREPDKVFAMLEKYSPEIVFHAAAYKHVPMMEISATEAIKNNVFGTLNVIEQCKRAKVKKFVLISTDKAVNPANVMGASKRIAEMLIQTQSYNSQMQMAAVRFGNVLGSNGSVIPTFLKQIKENKPITLTDRNIKRYFMSIPEAVRLVLQTGALANKGEVFVLDMGEPVYVYDLACTLIRLNGYVPERDIPIHITGLRPGEKLFEELRYDKEKVDKTVHEGIFVTRLEKIDKSAFEKNLLDLKAFCLNEDEEGIIKKIFEIVPKKAREIAQAEREMSLLKTDKQTDNESDTVLTDDDSQIQAEYGTL